MYRLIVSVLVSVALVAANAVYSEALAAKGSNGNGGGGGKPGNDPSECVPDLDPLFPAWSYKVDKADPGLGFGSSDGCTIVEVPVYVPADAILGEQVLTYDDVANLGYYAWLTVDWVTGENFIFRQHFTVQDDSLSSVGDAETLYRHVPASPQDFLGGVQWFDLRGDQLFGVDVDVYDGNNELFMIDTVNCTTLPCGVSDRTQIFSPSTYCLEDVTIFGCFKPEARHEAVSLDQNSIYFGMTGDGLNGGSVYAIGRVTRQDGVWSAPELFIREDMYDSIREPSLSQDGRYLSVGYLQPQASARILIFDLDTSACNGPCLAGLMMDFQGIRASWTAYDTLIFTGTEGKGRKTAHPVTEFNPATGDTRQFSVSFGALLTVDSSL